MTRRRRRLRGNTNTYILYISPRQQRRIDIYVQRPEGLNIITDESRSTSVTHPSRFSKTNQFTVVPTPSVRVPSSGPGSSLALDDDGSLADRESSRLGSHERNILCTGRTRSAAVFSAGDFAPLTNTVRSTKGRSDQTLFEGRGLRGGGVIKTCGPIPNPVLFDIG